MMRCGAGTNLHGSARLQARLVRLALERALGHLREQAPGVVAGRRERSLMRSLPSLLEAVTGAGGGWLGG